MNSPVQIWRQHKILHQYLNKIGRLIVWTKIFVAPVGFEHQTPYLVGIVQLDKERMPLGIITTRDILRFFIDNEKFAFIKSLNPFKKIFRK